MTTVYPHLMFAERTNRIPRDESRILSDEFENAVNKALTADKTSSPAITQESSLALTAVWACVRILSETVGILPIHLYRQPIMGGSDRRATLRAGYSKRRTAFPPAST
ncbi:hypothetical protein SAMN05444145_101450 [Alistipes timonensis JC136]|uniref:Phage portal protein n=2 Tax=Alistipes timonensis TaxID=1465754 RepID=A0A1H3Y7E2_9BACT|nr:hypothetical protein SAMN05444145_101450 [Alistipes timonensis JC136]